MKKIKANESLMEINLNKSGLEILKEYYKNKCKSLANSNSIDVIMPKALDDGSYLMTLVDIISIFGPHISDKSELPFDPVIKLYDFELEDYKENENIRG